jgi:hypothetical protein
MTWREFIQQGDHNLAVAIITMGPAIDRIMGPVTAWQLKHACIKQGEPKGLSDVMEKLDKAHEQIKTDEGICATLAHAALHMDWFLDQELSEEDLQHANDVLAKYNAHPHLDEGDQNDPDIEYPNLFRVKPEDDSSDDDVVDPSLAELFGNHGKIDD